MPVGSRDRMAAETARAEPDLLEAGTEAGQVGIWRWDVKTGRLAWSANMESIHRLPTGVFDGTFETFARDIHEEDRERVMAEIAAALQMGETYRVEYRLPADTSGETYWIEARGRVLRAPDGKPVSMTGICQDITAHKQAEAELALRARQQEAVVHLGESALAGVELAQIFTEAVNTAAELVSADLVEILELAQDRDSLVLRAGHGWADGAVGSSPATSEADTLVGLTLRSPVPIVFSDMETETRFTASDALREHGIRSGAAVTIRGNDERPFGVLGIYCKRKRCISPVDVRFLQNLANVLGSAIRAAQEKERRELLIGELRHRVGNLFSLVQALHRQTGQSATDARDLEMKFGARLSALASAHALILDGGWQQTSLRSLLQSTLAPYIERVSLEGADLHLPADAAFSFSLALHELATNANKYGALSEPEGRLVITCKSVPDALGRKALIVWKEQDGPPPPERESAGFGSRLIAQVVERQLGGAFRRDLEPDGLRITMEFPLA